MAKASTLNVEVEGDDETLPITRVIALRDGHACPYGENRARIIKAGEEFLFEGKRLGKWMVDVTDASAQSRVRQALAPQAHIPDIIKKAMGRAKVVQDGRAAQAEAAMDDLEGRAALKRAEKRKAAEAGKVALAAERADAEKQ